MPIDAQEQATRDLLARWAKDPVTFVREAFHAEPDDWQIDVLRAVATHNRIAMQACKGPGKSCVDAWIAWWFLLTRPMCKVACTSISGDNLADGLWTEMAKWQQKNAWLVERFVWTKTRIFAREFPETWWMSARTWSQSADSQKQADTLAGLHADFILFLLDEVGGIPDGVMAAAEAGMSTGIECKMVISGNPTHLSGPLYRAVTQERHLWYVVEITGDPDDPKRSKRISVDWARQQIEKYGRDNPWVLVNVFGKFPPASINSLLGVEDVLAAMKRSYKQPDLAKSARVIGVDVARQGDDATVLFPRQGLAAFPPIMMRNADSLQIAGRLAKAREKWEPDAVFVDASGGWGWGAIDQYRQLGHDCVPVEFAGKPADDQYYNKRTEMYFLLAQWVKSGGALPDVPELVGELTEPTYTFKGDRMLLEPKEQIKERLGRSPDYGDALALTFAAPVAPRSKPEDIVPGAKERREAVQHDYDPLASGRR